jgi:hypothetical protein
MQASPFEMFNSSIKAPVEAIIHSTKCSQRLLEKELKNGLCLVVLLLVALIA